MRSKALPFLGLVVLAVVTAALVLLALVHVRPRTVSALPLDVPAATTAAPTPSAAQSPTASPRPRTAQGVKDAMGEETVDVVVLGDASGAGESRWVSMLATTLGADRSVRLTEVAGGQERTRGLGSGQRTVNLRNLSDADLTLSGAAGRAAELVPATTDVVVLSFGHREGAGTISSDLDRLVDALPRSATVLVVVQNPEKGTNQQLQRDRTRAVADWARQNKLPYADVFQAFTQAPEPLADLLDKDMVMPNATGSRLFADTVARQLG